jgi:putative endonuclease
MHYFYVLYSLKDNRLYKGYTSDLPKRILAHNKGQTTSTKHRRPLILIYFEVFDDKVEALTQERLSKTLEGGAALKQQLKNIGILNKHGLLNIKDK